MKIVTGDVAERSMNMKVLASLSFLACLAGFGFGQVRPIADGGFMRITVKHADPWSIKALLEGFAFNQPELSTILGFAGIPDKDSELISSLFGGQGRLVVNPTDNSILFIPDRKRS